MNEQQAKQGVLRAEARYHESIQSLERFFEAHGTGGSPLARQALERSYKASQRAMRAARTRYATLANQHGWSLPV